MNNKEWQAGWALVLLGRLAIVTLAAESQGPAKTGAPCHLQPGAYLPTFVEAFLLDLYNLKYPNPPNMPKVQAPELKKYMDKRLSVKLNGNREVSGVLRGFDQFMNIVLEDAREEGANSEGAVMGQTVIRGSAIVMIEALERI